MQITKNKYVRLDYQLTSDNGQQIASSQTDEPLIYVHGTEHLLEGLEQALEGHSEGDELEVELTPEQAYGQRRPELVHEVSRDQFPPDEDIQPGMAISATGPHGELKMVVVKTDSETVTLDANHLLAGMTLVFALKVLEIRDATAAELASAAIPED